MMDNVRKTVGVYERPPNRGAWRAALVAAAVAVAGLGAAAVAFLT